LHQSMIRQFLSSLLALSVLLLCVACYTTVEGNKKFGMPLKDKITNSYEQKTVAQVFEASKKTLALVGRLTREDILNKSLKAKVDTRTVWVKVEALEPDVTGVTVQARRGSGRSDIDLASEIATRIALNLTTE
jgi:hypothetical protein